MNKEPDISNNKPVSKPGKHNMLMWIILVCSLLMISSIVLLYFVMQNEKALKGADQAIRLSAQGGFSCEYSEAQKLYPFAEGVLKVTNDRIAYLTLSGNEIYSISINYANPQCQIKGDNAVVFDVDGYSFTVLNKESISYTKPTTNKIKAAYLSNTCLCSVLTDSDEAFGKVLLFNTDGSSIMEWESNNSGYPLAFAFNNDDTQIAISSVNTNGAVCQPYVRIYNITTINSKLGVTDGAVYEPDTDSIISSLFYINNRLFCFSSEEIFMVDNNDQLNVLGSGFGNIIRVNNVGNKIFIVYSDGIDQINKLAIITEDGTTVYNSPVGSSVNAVSTTSDRYALSIDKRIYVFDVNGSVISDLSVDEDVLRIGFINNNKLLIVSTGGVHTVDY